LYALSHGWDERPVHERDPEKSISNEHTYMENQTDPKVLHQTLLHLTEKVGRRLRAAGYWANCVQIKIRSHEFKTFTRQRQLQIATRRDRELFQVVMELYEAFHPPWPVRLLGVGVTHLSETPTLPNQQLDLFAEPEEPKSAKLDETVDRIREKYGATALKRGRWNLKR